MTPRCLLSQTLALSFSELALLDVAILHHVFS